jgi:hypothetical protein
LSFNCPTAVQRIEQGGVILKGSKGSREFRSFLLDEGERRILKKYGFSLPAASAG